MPPTPSRSRRLARVGIRERIHLPSGQSFRLLRWEESLGEVQLLLGPGRSQRLQGEGMHWHYHQALELIAFERGEGTRFVGDQVASFSAGDVVLLGENLPHYWQTRGPSSGLLVQWHWPEGHPVWALPDTLSLTNLFQAAGRGIQFRGGTAAEIMVQLRRMAQSQGPARLGALLQALGGAAAAPARDQVFLSEKTISLSDENPRQQAMRMAVGYLLANFRDRVKLEDVLEAAGMTKATFSRQFRRHSGQTVSDFLQKVRLEAVCRELTKSNQAVIDVALGCGFSEISFFNRVFRRRLGCTPTAYRERQAKKKPAGNHPGRPETLA